MLQLHALPASDTSAYHVSAWCIHYRLSVLLSSSHLPASSSSSPAAAAAAAAVTLKLLCRRWLVLALHCLPMDIILVLLQQDVLGLPDVLATLQLLRCARDIFTVLLFYCCQVEYNDFADVDSVRFLGLRRRKSLGTVHIQKIHDNTAIAYSYSPTKFWSTFRQQFSFFKLPNALI